MESFFKKWNYLSKFRNLKTVGNTLLNIKINFKKTVPKNLATKGKISTLVIQALKQIKKENIDEQSLHIILQQLKKESNENILHDAKLAPAWIRTIMLISIETE